jgi:hypothetical protein
VTLGERDGLVSVTVTDPARWATPETEDALRRGVADDLDRLAALGGDLEVGRDDNGALRLLARVPDDLEPLVTGSVVTRPANPR